MYLFYKFMCAPECVCVPCACKSLLRPEEGIRSHGIRVTDGCEKNMWVLGPEPRFSARTICALNHWAFLQLSSERPSPSYSHAPTVFCLCALPLDNIQMPPSPAYSIPTSAMEIITSNYFFIDLSIYLWVYVWYANRDQERASELPGIGIIDPCKPFTVCAIE